VILQANALSPLYAHAAVGCDVMLVDPPYAPKVHAKAVSAGTAGAGVRKRDLGFGHLTPALMLRLASYAAQVRRWSAVFTDLESAHLWIGAMSLHGVEYVRTVPWVRWSQPQMSGDRPPTGAEAICIFHAPRANQGGGKMHWNGPGNRVAYRAAGWADADPSGRDTPDDDLDMRGVPIARAAYEAKSLRGRDKYSCEKPLDLMLALVSDYSDPGETVFDPCAGSGTTLLAARLLGREAFGLERDAAAHAYALTRLIHDEQPGAFGADWKLSARDEDRACRWLLETRAEASAVPAPRAANGSDVKTWERAQRRLADCKRLEEYENKS